MDRFTKISDDGYIVSDEDLKKAIRRLAEFENAYEDLIKSREQIPIDLQNLRKQGKEKTASYKEAVANKLIHNSILMFFEKHGIK